MNQQESWPKIAVVGAGAVGGYFGGLLARAGAPVVMIGRAAIGNPWILRDTIHYLRYGIVPAPPTLEERIAAALEHVTDLARTMGEERAGSVFQQ